MKLNRKLVLILALVLSLAMATGGTLAFLTDRDTEVNVFTFGNVDIELDEAFIQDSELIPGMDIAKKPTITNVGRNDAWVWATIAIPSALDDDDASKNVVHFNMTKESVADGQWTWWEKGSTTEWLKEKDVDHEGVKYNVYTVLYQTVLKPGETTENPVIYKVYMDDHVDIHPDGQLYHVENGVVTDLNWNVNTDGSPKIFVSAYAMQTNEFADVYAAYAAYTNQWPTTNDPVDAVEWGTENTSGSGSAGSNDPIETPTGATVIKTADELSAALTNGGNYKIGGSFTIGEALTVSADTAIYNESAKNVITVETTGEIKVAANTSLALYGVQMDAQGSYSFDENGDVSKSEENLRTKNLLSVGAGSTLTLDNGAHIENVVSTGKAVIYAAGTQVKGDVAANPATVILKDATIENCAGDSGAVINIDKQAVLYIEEGAVIANNVSCNNNNHGIIRVYNAWDAANPSKVIMNGGEIKNNKYSGNGMIGLYYGHMIMNGGSIHDNEWFEDNQVSNGWYPVVYVHSNSVFTMNDGSVIDNTVQYGAINSLNSSKEPAIIINGGTIKNNAATNNSNKDAAFVVIGTKDSLSIKAPAKVSGTVWEYYDADGNRTGTYTNINDYLLRK